MMVNYQHASIKLANTQLNKLKSVAKNQTGTTLRQTKKNFQDEKLSHELFLTTRRKTKIRNAFTYNTSTDITQISEIIQSGGFLGSWLGKLSKKVVTELDIPFAKNNLPGLVSNIASNAALNAIKNLKEE